MRMSQVEEIKHKVIPLLLVIFILVSCTARSNGQKPYKMKLQIIKEAETIKTVSESASANDVSELIETIDWNIFHQVLLVQKKNDDFIEVGGSKEDGFSVLVEIAHEQFVIEEEPTSPRELEKFLLRYLEVADLVMQEYKFY